MPGIGLIRLQKELKMLAEEPPPGVGCWPAGSEIQGPEGTPYERGTFLLDVQIPDRYPFEPPKVRFVTPIFHPNIDSGGRICLDTLKMKPAGSWAPSMNVPTLLTTIRLLMAHPNGDDGLMPDITELFLKNPSRFADVARTHVEQHARQDPSRATTTTSPTTKTASTGASGSDRCADEEDSRGMLAQGNISESSASTRDENAAKGGSVDSRYEDAGSSGGTDDDRGVGGVQSQVGSSGELERAGHPKQRERFGGVAADDAAETEQRQLGSERDKKDAGSGFSREAPSGGSNGSVGVEGKGGAESHQRSARRSEDGGGSDEHDGESSDDGAWSESDDDDGGDASSPKRARIG